MKNLLKNLNKGEEMEKISIVIPCYCSEHTITDVVNEILDVTSSKKEYEIEIILVNDGSPDNVWKVICNLVNKHSCVKGFSLSRNFGQHAALMAGYHNCSGDIVISADDDGQSPIDELYLLIEKIHDGYDVVYGKYPQIKQTAFRILGSWINEKMSEHLLGKPKGLKGNSFNAIRKYVIDEMLCYENPYPYMEGLVLRVTKNITNVTVHQRQRLDGKSGYSLKKLIKLWLNGFTAFSEKPLRIAVFLGFCCSMFGFGYGLITIIRRLIDPLIQVGYSSIMATILFIGGVIMLLLGIIGEYVGRIYISINNAPQYVIREKVENESIETK